MMLKPEVNRESKCIVGHVLDVSKSHLEEALQRYDSQLYLKWKPTKKNEKGAWQLRRKPELKSVAQGYSIETPRGVVGVPGDILDCSDWGLGSIVFPKFHETSHDVVKSFEYLDYRILDWVVSQDLWKYGFKGQNFANEAAYKEAKYEEKIDEDSYNDKIYDLRQMRTQISDFKSYVLAGGNPYRLFDYWK